MFTNEGDNPNIGDEGIRIVASNLQQLKCLGAHGVGLSDVGAAYIAKGLSNLRELEIGSKLGHSGGNSLLGRQGVRSIAHALKQLNDLDIRKAGVTVRRVYARLRGN